MIGAVDVEYGLLVVLNGDEEDEQHGEVKLAVLLVKEALEE